MTPYNLVGNTKITKKPTAPIFKVEDGMPLEEDRQFLRTVQIETFSLAEYNRR